MGGDFIFDSGSIFDWSELELWCKFPNWLWVGGIWGKCCCPEHLMLLLLALAESPLGLVGHGWNWPLGLHGPLPWTDVTCFCLSGSILSQFYGLQEHFCTFNSISASFPKSPEHSCAGKRGGFTVIQGGFAVLMGVQASLLICCWDFWFILWLDTGKIGDRNGPWFHRVPLFAGK